MTKYQNPNKVIYSRAFRYLGISDFVSLMFLGISGLVIADEGGES